MRRRAAASRAVRASGAFPGIAVVHGWAVDAAQGIEQQREFLVRQGNAKLLVNDR